MFVIHTTNCHFQFVNLPITVSLHVFRKIVFFSEISILQRILNLNFISVLKLLGIKHSVITLQNLNFWDKTML